MNISFFLCEIILTIYHIENFRFCQYNKKMDNQTNLRKNLAEKLKTERFKRKLSQEKLAAKTDLSLQTIGSIERQENYPSIDSLAQIADALDMKLCDLLNFD